MGRLDNLSAAAPQKAPLPETNSQKNDPTANSNPTAKVETRYQDAYRKALFIVGVGKAIHAVGAVIGIFVAIGGFSASAEIFNNSFGRQSEAGVIFGFMMLLVGGTIWFGFFIASVIVSANGQQLLASLDSAVNSSPFMDMAGKARAMSLN